MMNRTMMEDKLDESSNFKFLEENTSEEYLLWVIKKGDIVNTFFIKFSEDINHLDSIREVISTPSCMHLYIYYLYHCHEGNCKRKGPFVEVMDTEGSQCIQRNNTLEVKTLGLIVVIFIPLTYISKVCYIKSRCCSCDNNP
jgi:hypothetical protein